MLLILSLSMTLFSLAYIPETRTIAEQIAKKAGKRPYLIEQELEFKSTSGDSIRVLERWKILNNRNIYLTATSKIGDQIVFQKHIAYLGSQKIFKNNKGELVRKKWPSEFYIPLFFNRSAQGIVRKLKEFGCVPDNYEFHRPPPVTTDDVKYNGDAWIRLSRQSGQVNFKIAQGSSQESAAVWIDQNLFAISGLRFSSGLQLKREKLERFKYGLYWPHVSEITWEGNSVKINLLSVASKNATAFDDIRQIQKMPSHISETLADQELSEILQQFYSRVR